MLDRATFEGIEDAESASNARKLIIEELKSGGKIRRTDLMESCAEDVSIFIRQRKAA